MLTKFTFRTIFFMTVLLLILPMIMSAAGTREGGNGITLDQEVIDLLQQVEDGIITLEEAKEEFMSLEKEYEISAQERVQVQKMMKDVDLGIVKAADCEEPLQTQLQNRDRIRTRTPEETPVKTQTKTQAAVNNNTEKK